MFCVHLLLALSPSWAADKRQPSVASRARTALDERRSEAERARAIVALAEIGSPEASAAIDAIVARLGGESTLGRVAVAARVQTADLSELVRDDWPEWAESMVATRLDQQLLARCTDPEIWRLELPSDAVVRVCAAHADLPQLAHTIIEDGDANARAQAAHLMSDMVPVRGPEVADALVEAVRWRRDAAPPLGPGPAVLGTMIISEELRGALSLELTCWRVSQILVGRQEVPERLDAELGMLLAPEITAYGPATQTVDWLYLLAAAGQDPGVVLDRLGLRRDGGYAVVLDELHTLDGPPRGLLPLLAHRSPIVRARAAEVLERQPDRAIAAIDHAVRWRPERVFPLRGDVWAPRLRRGPLESEAYTAELMQWVELASSRIDMGSLRAVLSLLAEPTNTQALSDSTVQSIARTLLEIAETERDPARSSLLAQGMDAVLRRVPLAMALAPAPEQVRRHP